METINVPRKLKDQIKTYQKPRYVETGKSPNYSTKFAQKRINQELGNMKWEIEKSEKSSLSIVDNRRIQTKSTFPDYMSKAGISSRKDFMAIINAKKGVRFERLKTTAIERLNHGYSNEHGYDTPNMEFRNKTGQVYDNKNVIFRRVRGRLIPMRVKSSERYDLKEDAPF
jgi:hypothetical protein